MCWHLCVLDGDVFQPWYTFRPFSVPVGNTCELHFLGVISWLTPQLTLGQWEIYILSPHGSFRHGGNQGDHPRTPQAQISPCYSQGLFRPSFLCCSWKMRRHSPLPSDLPWSCWQLFCSFLFLPLTPSTRGDLTTLSILCFLHLFFLYWLHSKLHVSQTWHTWSLRPSGSLWGGGGVGLGRISPVYLGMCAAPWTSAHFSLTITSLIGTLKNVSRHC